jgi:CheY-like chemotaxis protein
MKHNELLQIRKSAGASTPCHANSRRRILVVDHDSDVRQLSVDVLDGSGYDVEAVEDGVAAWEMLKGSHYDLIITENKMPGMTGIEMIEKLRAARLTIPVILATRHLPRHEFARKPWLLPMATLCRPFSNDDLLAAVKQTLRTDDPVTRRQPRPIRLRKRRLWKWFEKLNTFRP